MLIIHEESDDAILKGWAYFGEWRKSRNCLLLLAALDKLNEAERSWIAARGTNTPMRRHWQVLRRCVTRGIARLHAPLLAARTPAQTERALYGGGKRATLARADQLNDRALVMVLLGSISVSGTLDYARATQELASFGIELKEGYLKKRASQLGLTRRKAAKGPSRRSARQQRTQPVQPPSLVHIAPGRRRHLGNRY